MNTDHAESRAGLKILREGQERHFALSSRKQPDGSLLMIATEELQRARDIPEREAAEERFRAVFEYSANGHFLFDAERIIDCNQTVVKMLKAKDKTQVLATPIENFSPARQSDDSISTEKAMRMMRLATENGHHRFEWTLRQVDGNLLLAEVMLTPLTLSGKLVFLGIWNDISERKRQEELLHKTTEQLQLAVEGSDAGLFDWDFVAEKGYFSPKFKALLGYRDDELELSRDSWRERIHPEDRETVSQYTQEYMDGKTDIYRVEYRIRTKSGEYRWMMVRAAVIRDPSGKLTRMTGWMIDITENQRALEKLKIQEAKLVHAAKMSSLGEMAGGIAHEINNPLTIIQGYANRLSRFAQTGGFTPEQLLEAATRIEKTCGRISRIIRGLRNVARNGERDPFAPTPLRSLIEDNLELCRESFRQHNIRLEVSETPDIVLECQAVQLSQVLLNLLNNAFDAVSTQSDPWVQIGFEATPMYLRISVTDSGNGIPPEIADKLMQPFFTTKDIGKGTGLGLSISRAIIEEHRGELFLDRKCKNTRFIIQLPIAKL